MAEAPRAVHYPVERDPFRVYFRQERENEDPNSKFRPKPGDVLLNIIERKETEAGLTRLVHLVYDATYYEDDGAYRQNLASLPEFKDFVPGDLVLRVGYFHICRDGRTEVWKWMGLSDATLYVYWPSADIKGGPWREVAKYPVKAKFNDMKPISSEIDFDLLHFGNTIDFGSKYLRESLKGELILRKTIIEDPLRPWGHSWGIHQLLHDEDLWTLQTGDYMVRMHGTFFENLSAPKKHPRDDVHRLQAQLYRRTPEKKWTFMGVSTKNYYRDFYLHAGLKRRFAYVPKPGDVLITRGDPFEVDAHGASTSNKGTRHVKLYQDPHFFDLVRGDAPKMVKLEGASNIAVRLGKVLDDWIWQPSPRIEVYYLHESHSSWFFSSASVLPKTWKWPNPPDFNIETAHLEHNNLAPNFTPGDGDVVLVFPNVTPAKKRWRRENSQVFWGHEYNPTWDEVAVAYPYVSQVSGLMKPGDSVLRAGYAPATADSGAVTVATVQMYTLALDHWDRPAWLFKGWDKALYGAPIPTHLDEGVEGLNTVPATSMEPQRPIASQGYNFWPPPGADPDSTRMFEIWPPRGDAVNSYQYRGLFTRAIHLHK